MTGPLDFPMGAPPPFGALVPVRPPLWRVRMPLPLALDHVNVWLVEGAEGWTLIDTGIGDAVTRALWRDLLSGPLAGRPVARIVATHMHPDHVGLTGTLVAATGAPLVMPLAEYLSAGLLRLDQGSAALAADRAFLAAAGVPPAAEGGPADRRDFYRRMVDPLPRRFRRIAGGDTPCWGDVAWRARIGQGHAAEMLCLEAPALGVLIAADQILPSISPNVSVWPEEPEADPLGLFLDSLVQFAALPPDILVLPSHGEPFLGLHARIEALRRHHAERLDAAVAACRKPVTAWEVTQDLFRRPLDAHQRLFALGEALAHLNRLVATGRVERRGGAGESIRYKATK